LVGDRQDFIYNQPVPEDLVSVPEIAMMLGVSRQRVHQLIQAYEDFPEPVAELAVGRIWNRSDIEQWIASHPRRTGRPRSSG
jgi:predicted DNA-binding transcriptional regulator AlpA